MTHWKLSFPIVSAAMLSAVLGTPLAAQDVAEGENDDTTFSLGEITVTGTGIPTEVLKSPSSVTVVDNEQISRVPPTSVARVLEDVPGVTVTESGIERIRIRGESSQRVAILIDGQRVSDHTTYGTPILVSPTEIERIEVVRGPSSVVSGNRAIGGVVNIITKRGADKPVEVTVSGGYVGSKEGWRASTSVAGTIDNFDYRLSYSQSDLNDTVSPDGPLEPSGSEDRDIHAFAGYRFGNHYIGARVQDYDLSAEVYTGIPNFTIDLPERDLRKYSAFYEGEDLTSWMSMLKVNAYSQTIDRLFENDVTFGPVNVLSTSDDEQTTSGFQITANLEFAPGHRTVVGLELEDDRLISDKVSTTTSFGPPTVTTRYSDASIQTASIFGQHEISFNETLTGTFGLRYYNVESDLDTYLVNGVPEPTESNSDDRFLGSAGLVWAVQPDTILRANLSQGYTYPSLSQLYLTTTGGGGTTLGNPDLKPETSTNFEIGARVDRGTMVLDAAVFYSEAEDYIARVTTNNPLDPDETMYQNVDSADTWGFELAAEFDPGWWGGVRPYLSIGNVTREFTYANGFSTKDTGTPQWTGVAGLRSDWDAWGTRGTWDVFLRSESSTRFVDDTGTVADSTDAWTTLNLRGSVELTSNVDLNFEVGNIADASYQAVDQIPGAGRYVSLFLTATF